MSSEARTGWSLDTPAGATGAVAIVRLSAGTEAELDRIFNELGIRRVASGDLALRNLLGIDEGLVARWTATTAFLMPHGGAGVVRALCAGLVQRGFPHLHGKNPASLYPEATNEMEARMLQALSESPSALAINLLLDQPARWSATGATSDPERDRILNRLIHPPLVVAIGPSNIGKSTLANALAGRTVSVAADVPGTTRDHVGIMLDIAGLVVRYVDTPGLRTNAPEVESEASRIALELARHADLLLLCGDAQSPPPENVFASGTGRGMQSSRPVLRVALRTDLGSPKFDADVGVSAHDPEMIQKLVSLMRERLLPREMLAHPGPWNLWDRAMRVQTAS